MTTQIPKPVPPVHAKLKNLHLVTEIVKSGRANVVIIVPVSGEYDLQARALQDSVKKLSGINLEIVLDSVPRPDPLREHLILFGNRSTNRVIDDLYNRCCTFLDLYYPGRGGYVVRSLHNPFGDGHNIIFIGGSDLKGVKDATDAFVNLLSAAACESGRLAVDRIMELRISKEIACPRDLNEMRTWDDATDDVPPSNRFGWNSLSLRMAAYYMTGDEFHAREFLRLAFPDEQAKQEIAAFDGEMIEDKNHPLAGPYHYGAHWMILLWDLIEESPVFTDNQRLRITNAFAQQLAHRARECGIWECTAPVQHIGSRHAAWNAVSLYLLSRYFRTYYPGPIWEHATAVTSNFFSSLHQHACLGGESDSHAWYNTCLAPILEYLLLSGDRHPVTNGVLAELLRGQDILSTGVDPDWAIVCGAASFFNQAAYLLQDGVYANYTGRKKLKSDVLRLGQSFLPAPGLGPVLPQRLVEKWSIQRMPEPMWRTRNSGLPWEDAFQYASFRSAADATGDYILLDGYMGSGRNAYHNFSLLELRLAGNTVLQGHCNQLLVWRDGMVGPQVAQDAALKWCDVIGKTVTAVGEVNNPGLCAWKRTIIQRIGLFTLVADEIIPSASSRHFNVQIRWESTGDWVPVPDKQILAVKGIKNSISGRKNEFAVIHSDPVRITISEKTIFFESIKDLGTAFATVEWEGCAESGHPKTFVSLIVKTAPIDGHSSINGGIRITENAVIFPYPSPLLSVTGKYDGFSAELLILEEDHLFGKGTTKISVEDHSVFVAERPVAIDWDFHEKKLTVLIQEATDLVIMGKRTGKLLPGKHVLTDDPNFQRAHELLKKKLADVMRYQKATAKSFSPFFARKPCGLPQEGMASLASQGSAQASPEAPPRRAKMPRGFRLCLSAPPRHVPRGASSGPLSAGPVHSKNSGKQAPEISLDLGDPIREMVGIMHAGDPLIGVAAQNCFYLVTPKGKIISETRTEGAIRKIHCWQEQNLILIGCADEKVIALDTAGKRKWTFISEMAPAVLKMGKTYWFKSATGNGNEGIHGIGSGVFLNGKSQLFIGSACTLEILAEDGNLIKRIPVFFGPGTNIRIIEGPRNSLNLLISRCPADGPSLAVVNNMALDPPAFYEPNLKVTTVSPEHSWHQSTVCPTVHSFGGLPAGHTRITGGFGSMITDHVFVDDINADGAKEVICCVNRTWSRITVYAADGTPLANANFGPGAQNFGVCGFDGKTAGKRIQDVDIAEINGKKVIVAAVSDGTLVGLDQNCQTIWSERLPVPPTVMKAINGADNENAALIVGGEDGGIFTFNTTDAPALIGRVIGKPSCICGIGGSLAMIGTDRGKIRGFRLK